MKHQFFSVKLYLLAFVGYLTIILPYLFYKKNISTETLSVADFPKIAIKNQHGEYKTISEYKGRTILVDFWFSACPPCLHEMKYFPELLERYEDLVIMSFSIDTEPHTLDLLEKKPIPWNFLDKNNPRWTFYNVDQKEKNGYVDILKVNSFPTYFMIDKEGKLVSSPRSALFSVEKELGALFLCKVSLKSFIDDFDARRILKILGLFHGMMVIMLLIRYRKNKLLNQH